MDVKLNPVWGVQIADAMIELGMASKAKLFLMPMQDVLKCDTDMRINEPGTVKAQNWSIKFNEKDFSPLVSLKLKTLCAKYNR